jgi:hypothetical protein
MRVNESIDLTDINSVMLASKADVGNFQAKERQAVGRGVAAWQRLWGAMSMERAPWYIPGDHTVTWKRDKSACFGFLPARLCRRTQKLNREEINGVIRQHFTFVVDCERVTPRKHSKAQFGLSGPQIVITPASGFPTAFLASEIKSLFHQSDADIQLFLDNGRTFLLDFPTPADRDAVLHQISTLFMSSHSLIQNIAPAPFLSDSPWQRLWLDGRLSNYEYLLFVNHVMGRSFNDLDNYPIFPWVLRSYADSAAASDDLTIYRDLTIPPPSQTLNRRQVISYLQFVDPFATFHAAERLPSASGITDFLDSGSHDLAIPEFFASPEIIASPQFTLPVWSDSPLDFVYRHRQHLESPLVSAQLPSFIAAVLVHGPSSLPRAVRVRCSAVHEAVQYHAGLPAVVSAVVSERPVGGVEVTVVGTVGAVHVLSVDAIRFAHGHESPADNPAPQSRDRRPASRSLSVATIRWLPITPIDPKSLLVPARGAFAVGCGADLCIVDPALGLRPAVGLETGLRSVAALAADGD